MLYVCHSQGLPVVSHLESGILWRGSRQHDGHNLVLFHTGDVDTVIPQNCCLVSVGLISKRLSNHPGGRVHLIWRKWTEVSVSVFSWTRHCCVFLFAGQCQSTFWWETQAWSPTSYGLNIQLPDQKQGKRLLGCQAKFCFVLLGLTAWPPRKVKQVQPDWLEQPLTPPQIENFIYAKKKALQSQEPSFDFLIRFNI